MNAECAATWGAFCSLSSSVIPNATECAAIFAEAHTPMEKDKALRARYGDAIRKLEHFFPNRYKPLLYWLREEGDLFNAALMLKRAVLDQGGTFADSLWLYPPATRFAPPAPDSIRNTADLLRYYPRSITRAALQRGGELLAQSGDFFLFEAGCELGRIEALLDIASSFPVGEQTRLLNAAKTMIDAWEERLPRIQRFNPSAADTLGRAVTMCRVRYRKRLPLLISLSSVPDKDIYSPSWYFVAFLQLREKRVQTSSCFFERQRAS